MIHFYDESNERYLVFHDKKPLQKAQTYLGNAKIPLHMCEYIFVAPADIKSYFRIAVKLHS